MATAVAKWTTVQVQVPDVIQDIARILDDFIGALLAILDVVRAVLDVIKAFLVGLLDPISALIEAIISEIEGLLNDISQAGFYISGDLDLEPPFHDLLGGFQAYERRMIARLTDRTDPTRPNLSSRSEVIAVFLYASFDTTAIMEAIKFIDLVKAFFRMPGKTKAYTTPTALSVAYGAEALGVGAFGESVKVFKKGYTPTLASVRWQMSAPPGAGAISWPYPAPPAFLVEVSTVPDGLYLSYQTYVKNAEKGDDGEQHKVVGLVSDPEGRPFKLYGGASILNVDDSLAWTVQGDRYVPLTGDGKTSLFLYRSAADSVPVPPNALVIGDKHVLQRTFFVDQLWLGINFVNPGGSFSITLDYDDMPYGASFEDDGNGVVTVTVDDEPAREVYVRVSAVTADVQQVGEGSSFGWSISESHIQTASMEPVRLTVEGMPSAAKGDPSSPLKVTFPSASTEAFLETVTTALVVMVLSRADLVAQATAAEQEVLSEAEAAEAIATEARDNPAKPFESFEEIEAADNVLLAAQAVTDAAKAALGAFQPGTARMETGLEDIARWLTPELIGSESSRFFMVKGSDPTPFRRKLYFKCRALAERILYKTGPLPSSVEALLVDYTVSTRNGEKTLREVEWFDLDDVGIEASILDSLNPDHDAGLQREGGVAPNPKALGVDLGYAEELCKGTTILRSPGFFAKSSADGGLVGSGSADYSPVVFVRGQGTATIKFCRNVFLANPSILTTSASVLNVATAALVHKRKPGEGAWLAYRLFPQGLPQIEAFLANIVDFLNAIKAGLKGVMDTILAYINFIEARILELEALLQRIQSILDSLLSIQVPLASGLVVTASGTDGILQALVTAEDKPQDTAAVTLSGRVFQTTGADGKPKSETQKGGAYGCGVVLLAGGLPTALVELLQLILAEED